MSVQFSSLNSLDMKTKYLVHGYTRNMSQPHRFAKPVVDICILYYCKPGTFDPHNKGKDMVINDDVVTCIGHYKNTVGVNHIFLSNIITEGRHEWCFKIIKSSRPSGVEAGHIQIGINAINGHKVFYKNGWDPQSFDDADYEYLYLLTAGLFDWPDTDDFCGTWVTQYGSKCKTGDIISMYFDWDNLVLSYSLNGKLIGNAPCNKDLKHTEYKGVIYLYQTDDALQMISYKYCASECKDKQLSIYEYIEEIKKLKQKLSTKQERIDELKRNKEQYDRIYELETQKRNRIYVLETQKRNIQFAKFQKKYNMI